MSDLDDFFHEYDRLARAQLDRATDRMGHVPTPDELKQYNAAHGDKIVCVDEYGGCGLFRVRGPYAELLATAASRLDERYELLGVGVRENEGEVFLERPISRQTAKAVRRARKNARANRQEAEEEEERARRRNGATRRRDEERDVFRQPDLEEGGRNEQRHEHRLPRTTHPGHWARSRNGPWAFAGAGNDRY